MRNIFHNLLPLREVGRVFLPLREVGRVFTLLVSLLLVSVSLSAQSADPMELNIGDYKGKYNDAYDAFQVQLVDESEYFIFVFTLGHITELEPGHTYTMADCLVTDLHPLQDFSFGLIMIDDGIYVDYDSFELTYNRDPETFDETIDVNVVDLEGFAYKLHYATPADTPPTPPTPGESYYIRLDGTDLYFTTNEVADNSYFTYSVSSEKEAFVVTPSGDGFTIQSADNSKYVGHDHTNSWDFSDNADLWYIQNFEEPTSILKDDSKGFGVDDQFDGAGVYTDKVGQLWVLEPVAPDGIAAPVAAPCGPVKRLTRQGTLLSHPTGVYDLGGRLIKR